MRIYGLNDTFLYILKVNEEGHFYTDCIEFDTSILEVIKYDEFKNYVTTKKELNEDETTYELKILNYARNYLNSLYKNHNELFRRAVFCPQGALRSANGYFKTPETLDEIKLVSNHRYNNQFSLDMEIINDHTTNALVYFDYLFNLYFIREAQKSIRNDKYVKLFSHRELGYNSNCIPLNNDFSADIRTNFGYGSASYFLLTISYKGIKMIPYSRLVIYRYANKREFIRNTMEFELDDKSWYYALDFIRDVCNDYIDKSIDSFVKKYFVDECEKLCILLRQYLYSDNIKVSDNIYGENYYGEENIYEIQLEEDDLCVFRAEKVSGATKFINNLNQLNILFDTTKYINTINECCRIVLPMIENSISNCQHRIQKNTKLELELLDLTNSLQEQSTDLIDEINSIDEYISEKRKSFIQKSKIISNEDEIENFVSKLMLRKFRGYNHLKETYKQKNDSLNEKNSELRNVKIQIYKDNESITFLEKYKDIILAHEEK